MDATQFNVSLETDLQGHYQKKNIKVVMTLIEELKKQNYPISDNAIEKGLLNVQKNTNFIGRWYQHSANPLVICDTGHNKAGLDMVFQQLKEFEGKKHIVLGFVNDKKIDEVLQSLPENAEYYFVKPSINRGRNPLEYEKELQDAKISYQIFQNVQDGYLTALQNVKENEMIFIGGSNFVVGDFLEKNLQLS